MRSNFSNGESQIQLYIIFLKKINLLLQLNLSNIILYFKFLQILWCIESHLFSFIVFYLFLFKKGQYEC